MCENSARTTPKLRELCENCARTTPITAAAKSLAHAVQNAPNRFKTLQNAKNTKTTISLVISPSCNKSQTFLQELANALHTSAACTNVNQERSSGIGLRRWANQTTQHHHAMPNLTAEWPGRPRPGSITSWTRSWIPRMRWMGLWVCLGKRTDVNKVREACKSGPRSARILRE